MPEDVKIDKTPVTLLDFLIDNPQDEVQGEVLLPRLKGFKIIISAMTQGQVIEYRRQARAKGKAKGEFDGELFNRLIVENHVVDPPLSDPAVLKKAGVQTASQFIGKFFRPGEIQELVNRVTELSGYDVAESSELAEVAAKNS